MPIWMIAVDESIIPYYVTMEHEHIDLKEILDKKKNLLHN